MDKTNEEGISIRDLLPTFNSPQDVNRWHFGPLEKALYIEVKNRCYDSFKRGYWSVKEVVGLPSTFSGGEDPFKYDNHGHNNQILALVANSKMMLIAWSGSRGIDVNTKYHFSFDSALGKSFRTLSKLPMACYFLWCAAQSKENATFFFIPATDLDDILVRLSPVMNERAQAYVVKEKGYWWVKKIAHIRRELDAEKWMVIVKENNYDELVSRILDTLDKLPNFLKV